MGSFAKAMGHAMEPHVRGLLDSMFSAGLSPVLIEALEQITIRCHFVFCSFECMFILVFGIIIYVSSSIPSLLPTIQERLLDCISVALSKSPHPQAKPGVSTTRTNTTNAAQQVSDISGSVLVQLALRTLAHFNFKVCFCISYTCQI